MKHVMIVVCMVGLAGVPDVMAGPFFFDDFESGLGNWQKWPEATEALQDDGAHTRSGLHAAKQVEADPHSYASYHNFGPQSGAVYAEVYVWDDLDDDGTNPARPISNGLQLSGAGNPTDYTDYLQLGVIPWGPAGSTGYSIRTTFGYINTGVARQAGWTKLAIEADALADGGAVRFYIDDNPVGTSARSGVDLQYVRLGFTAKSYDNFWYDDVRVVPEPAGLLLLLVGGLALSVRRKPPVL